MIRIVESKFITSAVKSSDYPPTTCPDFAFVGRSNVGKSSMINTLTGRKLLAKIANKPGKTRLINFFECRALAVESGEENVDKAVPSPLSIGFVDLPGYGFAKVSKAEREQWQRMINEFFVHRQQLGGVVVLVDIRHDVDSKDAVMVDMLKTLGVNFMIAATKSDKIPKGKVPSALKRFREGFGLADRFICEFSSHTKSGQDKVLGWIEAFMLGNALNNRVIVH